MSFYSIADYAGDGSSKTFAVPFPYLEQDHVEVYVSGILQVAGTDYTWPNDGQVTLTTAPALGASVRVKRDTPKDAEQVTFTNGSQLIQDDLNNASLQLLYIQQEVIDYTAETLASITSIATSTGNVPTPQSPTDDNKVLRALAGTFAWTNTINVSSVTSTAMTCTGTLTVGNGAVVTGNVSCTGTIQADTGNISNTLTVGAGVASASYTAPLFQVQSEKASASAIRFWKYDAASGNSFTATTAKPQWELQVPSNGASLILNINVGAGPLNIVQYDYDSGSSTPRIRPCCHTIPATDGVYDLGNNTVARFRHMYLAGLIDSTFATGGGINVIADIQWDETTGRIQKRFIKLPITNTSPQSWADAIAEGDMVNV